MKCLKVVQAVKHQRWFQLDSSPEKFCMVLESLLGTPNGWGHRNNLARLACARNPYKRSGAIKAVFWVIEVQRLSNAIVKFWLEALDNCLYKMFGAAGIAKSLSLPQEIEYVSPKWHQHYGGPSCIYLLEYAKLAGAGTNDVCTGWSVALVCLFLCLCVGAGIG